jgi:hypothetical protein
MTFAIFPIKNQNYALKNINPINKNLRVHKRAQVKVHFFIVIFGQQCQFSTK